MAQSVLMVYEDVNLIKDKKEYWQNYISFYEKYWDGPATPKSSWWGREYEEFRQSLSNHLGIEENHIKDCFFIKDEEEQYYVCPIGSEINLNIYSCENFIPFEWFLLFESSQKSYFYTHTGYGAIHHDAIYYRTKLNNGKTELDKAENIIKKVTSSEENSLGKHPELIKLNYIEEGIANLKHWLDGFSSSGIILLNYGEICSFIVQDSMKNEDSVGELKTILKNLEQNDLLAAETNFKYLNTKWADISSKASGDKESSSIQ